MPQEQPKKWQKNQKKKEKKETSCLQPGNINSECYFNRKRGRKKGSKEKGKKRSKRQDPENFQKTCAKINMV